MGPWLLPLAVLMCLCTGCLTAARKVEQALRRDRDRVARPPAAKVVDLEIAVRPGRPRLFVAARWPEARDALAREWQAALRRRADQRVGGPVIEPSDRKLLARSREALKRLSLLAGVYRFTGDARYADAARRELLNVCGFDHWQPDDFLATSEMMTAVAIGYDWLHDALSAAERKAVVRAIADKGLTPALDAYVSQGGWTRARHNWNLVCNGGVIVASLAIAEEEPRLTREALNFAMASIRSGLDAFDDNGGTAEGPMYHHYASRYLTFAAAALATATAEPVALPAGGWQKAGDYRLAMSGPTGRVANFGDGADVLGNSAWMFWHALAFGRPDYAAFQAKEDRAEPSIFDLLWHDALPADAAGRQAGGPNPPRDGPVAFGSAIVLRGPGDDPLATFLALRTGSTADHHSHLDLGNFVLDMSGERFAVDLGADNYDLPGYLGPRRAAFLRSGTPGHNTLSLGDASQPLDAAATATLAGDGRSARIDLTDAYPGVTSVVRTAALDGRVVTITDEFRTKRSTEIVWNLHTPAKVVLTRGGATLEVGGKAIAVSVLEPAGAVLTAEPDVTRPPQQPVEGVTHVRLRVKVDREARIRLRFSPIDAKRER